MHNDADGDSLTHEDPGAYSARHEAGDEPTWEKVLPDTPVNLKEPIIFVVLGLFLQIFNLYVGLGLIIAGCIWASWRIISRITSKG